MTRTTQADLYGHSSLLSKSSEPKALTITETDIHASLRGACVSVSVMSRGDLDGATLFTSQSSQTKDTCDPPTT